MISRVFHNTRHALSFGPPGLSLGPSPMPVIAFPKTPAWLALSSGLAPVNPPMPLLFTASTARPVLVGILPSWPTWMPCFRPWRKTPRPVGFPPSSRATSICSQLVLRAPPLFEDPFSPFLASAAAERTISVPDCGRFRSLLAAGDVEGAAGEWSRLAESCLRSLAEGSSVLVGHGRGRIFLRHSTLTPKCRHDQALSDHGAALLKVIRRCGELLRPLVPMDRVMATWKAVGSASHFLPAHLRRLLHATRNVCCSPWLTSSPVSLRLLSARSAP